METSYLLKTRSVITVLVLLLVMGACKKDEDKKEKAKMQIDTNSLNFTSESNIGYFAITNLGEETLEWQVAKPQWLDVSDLLGKLDPGSKIITVTADLSKTLGSYEGTIDVTSNGGDQSINVTFVHDKQLVGIFPGEGVDNRIYMGDNYTAVRNEYGEADEVGAEEMYDEYDKFDGYLCYAIYEDEGLSFYFMNEDVDTIAGSDRFFLIEIGKPYSKKTSKGIGLNSSITEVAGAYGTPVADDIDAYPEDGYGIYWYMSLGVAFIYDLSTEKMIVIWVFNGRKSASTVIKQLGANFKR
ncbi:MAG: BACON domain-containing protein [Bacteroidales bacterium]|nr:BACON domain-containing protein [Bacteroidales bacterium]